MSTVRSRLGDPELRPSLLSFLEKDHQDATDTVILEELGLHRGQVRADIAVVNGTMHGYEIKSDKDTLSRLPDQVGAYSNIFEQVTLVVGRKHLSAAKKQIPDWWGILCFDTSGKSTTYSYHRSPKRNTGVNGRSVAELIWRDEALDLLRQRNADHGVRTKTRDVIWDRLCEVFSDDEILRVVRRLLKQRARQQSTELHA